MLFTIGKKHTEEQLLTGCKKRDEKIRNETYKQWAPYMKAVCLRYVADVDQTEDIMHEAFIKVFLNVEKLEWKGEGTFRAWVVRVMVNASIDHLKKTKRIGTLSIEYADDIVEDDDCEDETTLFGLVKQMGLGKDELMAMLESLPEANRLVFNLYAIEQMKHKEIAETLGIAEEASRARLKRARQQLKEKLAIRCQYKHKTVLV